jgi:hypothetical protein
MKQIQVRRKWMRAIWQEVTLDPHAQAPFLSQLRRNPRPTRATRLRACVPRGDVHWISWMEMAGQVVRAVVLVALAHDRHGATTPWRHRAAARVRCGH